MLDFMLKLETLIKIWPDNVKWSIIQIAEKTQTPIPHAVEFLTESLNKNLDIHDPMTFNEVKKAYLILQDKTRSELETRQIKERQRVEKATKAYEKIMDKIRLLQTTKNWRNAYRTLSYFYGVHKDNLPREVVINICDDCLRLGIKSEINFQELINWMTKGVHTLLDSRNPEVVEDALDFIDAYGDFFLEKLQHKGESFISNLLFTLKPSAMEFDLTYRFNEIASGLNLTTVMDITN